MTNAGLVSNHSGGIGSDLWPISSPVAAIVGFGVWTPEFPGTSAWVSRTPTTPPATPRGALVPPMLRRRISPLTAAMMDALAEASADTDLTGCAAVFASAHGETSVLAALLEQLTASPPALSPIAFASSVHNTASGLLSIATLNRGLSTSLAAGHDTVAAGFLEALGILHAGTTDVLVVVGDLAEPDRLVGAAERASLVAVVFHLRAAAALSPSGAHPVALVGWPMRDPSVAPSALAVSDDLARSPCAGGLSLVDAISGRVGGPVRLDGGAGDAWCINLSFPDLDVPDA